MKYCSHCGHPNQEDAFFSGSCGRPLNQKMERKQQKVNAIIPQQVKTEVLG